MFTKAYEEAKQLSADISNAISQRNEAIKSIEVDIKTLQVTKEENDKFMQNIETLLK